MSTSPILFHIQKKMEATFFLEYLRNHIIIYNKNNIHFTQFGDFPDSSGCMHWARFNFGDSFTVFVFLLIYTRYFSQQNSSFVLTAVQIQEHFLPYSLIYFVSIFFCWLKFLFEMKNAAIKVYAHRTKNEPYTHHTMLLINY